MGLIESSKLNVWSRTQVVAWWHLWFISRLSPATISHKLPHVLHGCTSLLGPLRLMSPALLPKIARCHHLSSTESQGHDNDIIISWSIYPCIALLVSTTYRTHFSSRKADNQFIHSFVISFIMHSCIHSSIHPFSQSVNQISQSFLHPLIHLSISRQSWMTKSR